MFLVLLFDGDVGDKLVQFAHHLESALHFRRADVVGCSVQAVHILLRQELRDLQVFS